MIFGKKSKRDEKPALRQPKTKTKLTDGGAWTKLAYVVLVLISLYLTASFYTPWTGTLGQRASSAILETIGGSSIIPILFALYFSISNLLSRKVPNLIRQSAGTLLLFFTASLLLGLNTMTSDLTNYPIWLSPGNFGTSFAEQAFSLLGAFGTFIAGALSIYISMLLYNIPLFSHIKLPGSSFFNLFRKKEKGSGEHAAEKTSRDDAINISEYEGSDYFGPAGEEIDQPPITVTGLGLQGSEESVYSSEQIQDPEFNLDEDPLYDGVEQGVFPPPIEIFGKEESHEGEMDEEKSMPLGDKIIKALKQFNIEARLAEILVGPTVIQFRIQLAPGIKVNKVAVLSNDIALAMAVPSLRIEAPIPGKPYVGIEIPNPRRRGIPLRTIIEDPAYQESDAALPLPFGVAVNGDSVITGLEELPHLLVAGTTGSGKSVFINSCIVGLCSMRAPDELRMILVDPKRVEMAIYDKLPHLLTPPVTDAKKAVHVLAWAIREMESRYTMFAKARVRNLENFNKKVIPKERLPHIVIVVDELADLMMTAPKEVEEYICRLAQMARATGIHLILATQRPSVNVITGLIKANIPARVAFTLPSSVDSRTIIDCSGAEKLLGKGDMLFLSTRHPKPIRIQSPWVDEQVLCVWLNYLVNLFGLPDFIEIDKQGNGPSGIDNAAAFDDDLLEDAVDTVMSTGIASASGLQRRLRVGFSRASRLIDMMEMMGIVGPADGSKPREILVDEDEARDMIIDAKNGY